MINSLIHRFLGRQSSREELQMLHDEVNRNSEEVLKEIEQDWKNFEQEGSQRWSPVLWKQLQSKIGENAKKSSSRAINLRWVFSTAATVFICLSVWFAVKRSSNVDINQQNEPKLLTEVNDSDAPVVVNLKDGTKVTLAAHSSLSFYRNYNEKYRVVHLDGEAYFETDKLNKRPFVVISDNITSICRGEEFSISAFKESDEINVALASGQIEIARNDRLNSENNKVSVKSCQQYSFIKSTDDYLIDQISDCEFDEEIRSQREKAKENIVML